MTEVSITRSPWVLLLALMFAPCLAAQGPAASFSEANTIDLPLFFAPVDAALADVLGSSEVDAAVISSDGQLEVLESTGFCTSPIYHSFIIPNGATRVVAEDLDDDGQSELYVASSHAVTVFNRFAGALISSTLAHPQTFESAMTFADVDGDGRRDIVRGRRWIQQLVGGGFATAADLPILTSALVGVDAGGAGDFNGDGLLDFCLVRHVPAGGGFIAALGDIHLADGQGGFLLAQTLNFDSVSGSTADVHLGDIDGDGCTDIVARDFVFLDYVLQSWRGTTGGVMQPFGNSGDSGGFSGTVRLIDLDDDGDFELAGNLTFGGFPAVTSPGATIYEETAISAFAGATVNLPGAGDPLFVVAAADVTGNGLTDIASLRYSAFTNTNRHLLRLSYNSFAPPAPNPQLSLISGGGQVAAVGSAFANPVVVELRDCEGQVMPSATLAVSGGGDFGVPATVQTDAFGRAAVPVMTTGEVGEGNITLISGGAFGTSLSVPLTTTGLSTKILAQPTSTTLQITYRHAQGTVPIIVTLDAPLAGSGFVSTLFGNLYSSLPTPGTSFVALDGLGLLGPADPTLLADPLFVRNEVIPFAATGQSFVMQVIAVDPGLPFPQSVTLSNPSFLTL